MADIKKENWFTKAWGSIVRYFRELKSELKKVVWSTPQQVLKNALIVVACVLIVGVFVWLFDFVSSTTVAGLIGLVQSWIK